MNKTESISSPLEFESPVEFILVGVEGKKRTVVAKSKGAKMDLSAYAQRETSLDDRPYLSKLFFSFPFPFSGTIDLWPLSVDSRPTEFKNNSSYDSRTSALTLVWRGSANSGEIKGIQKEFNIRVEEISNALDGQSKSQLEWALAPIIDRCYRITRYATEQRIRFRYAFWFGLLIYIVTVGTIVGTVFVDNTLQ